jgi:hypothetical protein
MLRSRQAHVRNQRRYNFPLVVGDGENVLDSQIGHLGRTHDDDHRTFPCGHLQPKDDPTGPPSELDQNAWSKPTKGKPNEDHPHHQRSSGFISKAAAASPVALAGSDAIKGLQ